MHEFNRALCQIELERNFAQGTVSGSVLSVAIVSDLKVARGIVKKLPPNDVAMRWLQINGIDPAGL